jgi:hypothetical protein
MLGKFMCEMVLRIFMQARISLKRVSLKMEETLLT